MCFNGCTHYVYRVTCNNINSAFISFKIKYKYYENSSDENISHNVLLWCDRI